MRPLRIIERPIKEEGDEAPLDIDADRMIGVGHEKERIRSDDNNILCAVRETHEFENGAIWLNDMYDWKFGTDSSGAICVVPLKK